MFNLKDFIKNGLLDAVGHMADYQIILNAAGWFDKSVLTEDDLSEIENAIKIKNIVAQEETIISEEETE